MSYSTFPQIFHHIKGTLQSHLMPWLGPFTVSFLYEEEQPPLRSTPWGVHTTRAVIPWFPSRHSHPLFLEYTYSINHHLPGTHLADPWSDGRLSLTGYLTLAEFPFGRQTGKPLYIQT